MRGSKPTPIKEALAQTLENIVGKKRGIVFEEDIKNIWEKAAGKEASKHSQPARIRGKTLVINVDSPTWIYQLNIKKERIEKELNRLLKRKEPINISLRAGED